MDKEIVYVSDSDLRYFRARCVVLRCHCGKEFNTRRSNWNKNKVKSCGCQRANYKHGFSCHGAKNPEFNAWNKLKSRCNDKNNSSYINYGGRGIKVCERWLYSFSNFISDMGLRPTPDHSLDRKDVNGDYEPSNCRWATKIVQANNTRANVYHEYNGGIYTLRQICDMLDRNNDYEYLRLRLKRGIDLILALNTPKRERKSFKITVIK